MTWETRNRRRNWARESLWLVPLGFAIAAVAAAQIVPWLDRELTLDSPFTYSTSSAEATLSSIASGMLVFTGFVFSIITFAVQYEAGTYSPRLLRTIATSTQMKVSLGVFIATFLYSLLVLSDVEPESDYRPQYSVLAAVVLVGVSVLLFLALVARVVSSVRSGKTVVGVARQGRHVIERTYPARSEAPDAAGRDALPALAGRVVPNARQDGGVVQAVDVSGLVALATEHDVVIELVPEIGSFAAVRAPLFRVYGDALTSLDERLQTSIMLGDERTSDQDPGYAIRILVDIAIRALSPAVNDPTTGVEALQRIGDLLVLLADRHLAVGVRRDGSGRVRFVQGVSSWEDYLALGLTETRLYGADSPFVAAEMQRVLSGLREVAPEWRQPAIEHQTMLLRTAMSAVDGPHGSAANVPLPGRERGDR